MHNNQAPTVTVSTLHLLVTFKKILFTHIYYNLLLPRENSYKIMA